MALPNIRIILLVSVVVVILVYLALLLSGRGLSMDGFANLGANQNAFTLYYMNGCPHCESILPEYKAFQASGQYKSASGAVTSIKMFEQADPAAASGIQANNVKGFPTFIFTSKDGKNMPYNGDRTVPAMKAFIDQNAR
jgi:hypothetical protein